jgi:PST family polysaccharide transporter
VLARRGVALRGRSIRELAARGVIVNSAFSVGLAVLSFARGLLIAHFLTREDYGIWGIVMGSLGTLFLLKSVGVGDKYVQQDDDDQELAFQQAFTIECILSGALMLVMLAAVPILAAAYGRSQLILPGLALVLLLPANPLVTPAWIFSRRMRFGLQRALTAIEPIVGTAAALALAIAGAGYWSLIAGVVIGAWVSALVTWRYSPYKLRFRFDRRQLRSYFAFSWPLLVVTASGLVMVQASLFFGTEAAGLAGAGAIWLAASISQFAQQVDSIVSGTMYPVVCAVQDRIDLLYESFQKSNRVALIWAVPFGVGLTLFAADLVNYAIGTRWRPAIPLLAIFGVTAALAHVGFNWDQYYRARGETRPIAWATAITTLAFLVSAIPLLYVWGLEGFAVGVAIQALVNVACRVFYLRRLFAGFDVLRHAVRACAPTVPAAAVVLLARVIEPRGRHVSEVLLELGLYAVIAIAVTWALERRLLGEMVGYLNRAPAQAGAPQAPHSS